MKGKHKHKWDYLRDILLERVVYDDHAHRAWYPDSNMTHGLVYTCKQVCVGGCVHACIPTCVCVCVFYGEKGGYKCVFFWLESVFASLP